MKSTLLLGFASTVYLIFVLPISAEEDAKTEKKAKKKRGQQASRIFELPAEITLDETQKGKIEELKKEFRPKLEELIQKRETILTPDQKSAQKAAQEKAKSEGLKGKKAKEAVEAAVSLSEEQKTKMKEVQEELQKLNTEVREKISGLLTEGQKSKLQERRKKKKGSN